MIDAIGRKDGSTSGGFEATASAAISAQDFALQLAGFLAALECLFADRFGLYASVDGAEGLPLYRLLTEHGLHTSAELQEKLGGRELRRLLEPQKELALDLSRRLRQQFPEEIVIAPFNLSMERWTPQEYRTLWGTVIRTRVRALYFGDDWEYSENCALEFKIAWEIGLPTFDAEGQTLTLSEGRFRIQNAVLELDADGFDTSGLAAALHNLGRQNRVAPDDL